MLINSSRIRTMISDCKTEPEIISVLRSHKIKYSYATDTGFLSIRIPCRKGYVRIYRTCSRSAPFHVKAIEPQTIYSFPVLHPDY